MYFIQKNVTRILNNQTNFFLNPKELLEVKKKLSNIKYSIYYPYKDSEKILLYTKNIPEVLLYEIKAKIPIRHQDILGSMYSLNIAPELFGDILIINNHYYIYILPIIRNYFETNFLKVKNSNVILEEISIEILKDYERKYESFEIIVSSNRIDTVISRICNISRNNFSDMIKKKEIILNYDFLKNSSYKLKENDTFSIKGIGKFKYIGVLKNTKGNNCVIQLLKYL